jgi:hypothetical protein
MDSKQITIIFGIFIFVLISLIWKDNVFIKYTVNITMTVFLWHGLWVLADYIDTNLSSGDTTKLISMLFIPFGILYTYEHKLIYNPFSIISDFVVDFYQKIKN